ncbi:MAG TPA: DUF6252 family protein [Flavobacterium sp.]|jgi:hypothetical protein
MKKISFLALLFISALTISCSEEENSEPDNSVDENDYFNYTADGVDVPIESWTAVRSEHNFEVVGQTAEGGTLYFDFNAMGDLARATSTPPIESDLPWQDSFYEFTSHYFDFEIVAIDEVNKIIKVNYSGNLYEEEYDLNSASTMVEGSFNVHYIEVEPIIPGLGVKAQIDDQDWYSVKSSTTIIGIDDITVETNSDDAYKISLHFNDSDLTVGMYDFTNGSTPEVILSKYDPATQTYTDYECTGTLVITDKSVDGVLPMITGTFSFTAFHPQNDTEIRVTNGVFKQFYSN